MWYEDWKKCNRFYIYSKTIFIINYNNKTYIYLGKNRNYYIKDIHIYFLYIFYSLNFWIL